jgi:hypothetical protein
VRVGTAVLLGIAAGCNVIAGVTGIEYRTAGSDGGGGSFNLSVTVTSAGAAPPQCTFDEDCKAATVCKNGSCVANQCVFTDAAKGVACDEAGGTKCDGKGLCRKEHCFDEKKSGDEADVDCGGSCAKCADAKKCSAPADCESTFCATGTCCKEACSGACQTCDTGSCALAPKTKLCNMVYLCNGTAPDCPTSCKMDNECKGYCSGDMKCFDKKENGQDCGANKECKGGTCCSGKCQDTTC